MKHRKFVFLVLIFVIPAAMWGESSRKKVKEGNSLYAEKKYDQALTKYQDALLSDPKNKRIQFNVANTLYWKKKYEETIKEYQEVIGTEEFPLEQQAYFNLGNAFFRMGKLPESILAYQQALKLNPNDIDAKYNLEYVRRKLKQDAQKQPQNGQEQQRMDQKEQKQGEEKENQELQESQPQEQGDQNELSKEEAERILEALKNDEKDIQKKRRMKASGKYRVKKDW